MNGNVFSDELFSPFVLLLLLLTFPIGMLSGQQEAEAASRLNFTEAKGVWNNE